MSIVHGELSIVLTMDNGPWTMDDSPMPDALAIALEHHRAGRVRQAADAYRALIAQDPHHADALNWLGVLAFQAGRPDHAIPLLERATNARPEDPAFAHNLGMA